MLELKREYNDLIDEYKPVLPFEFVPVPETEAATSNNWQQTKKTRINLPIEEGTVVELRLDIRLQGIWDMGSDSAHKNSQTVKKDKADTKESDQ